MLVLSFIRTFLQVSSAMAFSHLLSYLLSSALVGNSKVQQSELMRLLQHSDSDEQKHMIRQVVLNLTDACMKLQHAYLNIINIVLYYSTVGEIDGPGASLLHRSLGPWRNALCEPKTELLAVITARMEQSSSSIVRAKSLLCIQLLDKCCRVSGSNRVLRSLGDNRRFISAVARCLETGENVNDSSFTQHNSSIVASPSTHKAEGGTSGLSSSREYIAKCAYSFVLHIQNVLRASVSSVAADLKIATDSIKVAEGEHVAVLAHRLQNGITDACSKTEKIFGHFDTVRACVAVSSSQLLLKMIMSDVPLLRAAGDFLKAIKPAQLACSQFTRLWKQTASVVDLPEHSYSLVESFVQMVSSGEQVALGFLESVAQLEVHTESVTSAAVLAPASSDRTPTPRGDNGRNDAIAIYSCLLDTIIPSAFQLLSKPCSGDVRVLVSVCLRRLLPNLCAIVSSVFPGQLLTSVLNILKGEDLQWFSGMGKSIAQNMANSVVVCLTEVLKSLPQLLSDRAPVPQYAVRLVTDLALTSHPIVILICHEIQKDFRLCSGGMSKRQPSGTMPVGGHIVTYVPHRRPLIIDLITRLLPAAASAVYCPRVNGESDHVDNADEQAVHTDSQAAVLLRILVEKCSTAAGQSFLQHLSSVGHSYPASSVESIARANSLFMTCLSNCGLCWAVREAILWALIHNNIDHLTVLLDLLQTYLNLLIVKTGDDDNTAGASVSEYLSQRNTAAEYLLPVCAWLSAVVSCVVNIRSNRMHQLRVLESVSSGRNWSSLARAFMHPDETNGPRDVAIDSNSIHLIQDGCVSCLTLLSELSPGQFVKVRF